MRRLSLLDVPSKAVVAPEMVMCSVCYPERGSGLVGCPLKGEKVIAATVATSRFREGESGFDARRVASRERRFGLRRRAAAGVLYGRVELYGWKRDSAVRRAGWGCGCSACRRVWAAMACQREQYGVAWRVESWPLDGCWCTAGGGAPRRRRVGRNGAGHEMVARPP